MLSFFKDARTLKKEENVKETKNWFIGLPPAVLFVGNLLVVYIREVITRDNAFSGLAPLMGTGEEEWIEGVSEAVMALEEEEIFA
jgi:hypothetical protein